MEIKIENRLGEIIRSKGIKLSQGRGMDFYEIVLPVTRALELFENYSLPKLSGVVQRQNIKGHIYCGISLSKVNKIYNAVYIHRYKPTEVALISFWNHQEEGWLMDLGLMLKLLFIRLKQLNVDTLKLQYRSFWKIAPYIPNVFAQFGKTKNVVLLYQVLIEDVQLLIDSPWFNRKIPEGCTLEKWHDKSYNELEIAFKNQGLGKELDHSLNPFQLRSQYDPRYSYLIKYYGKIIGWCLIHLIEDDKLQVTSIYESERKCRWMGLRCLAESAKYYHDVNNNHCVGHFLIQKKNTKMISFYDKVLQNLQCKKIAVNQLTISF